MAPLSSNGDILCEGSIDHVPRRNSAGAHKRISCPAIEAITARPCRIGGNDTVTWLKTPDLCPNFNSGPTELVSQHHRWSAGPFALDDVNVRSTHPCVTDLELHF